MKRPEIPHKDVFGNCHMAVRVVLLVGLFLMPRMTVLWIGYGLECLLLLYAIVAGIHQKCYGFAALMSFFIILGGTLLLLLQYVVFPAAMKS